MSTHTPNPVTPGTFSSVLPAVEDILEQVYDLLGDGGDKTQENVIAKAKDIQSQLAKMKAAASTLPGGELGAGSMRELTEILEDLASQRRAVLEAFCLTPTPSADEVDRTSSPAQQPPPS